MADAPIRLLVVDDHPIVLHGLEQLFNRHPGFQVVASCRSVPEALMALRATRDIDVAIVDLRMPGQDGFELLRAIRDERFRCRAVVLTATLRDADVIEVLRLGALGVVLKETAPDAVVDCIEHVARGEQWIDRAAMSKVIDHVLEQTPGPPATAALTPRELEIVRMVSRGLRNREIAQQLAISEGTVKIHLHNIYEKLGIGGRVELLLYAQDRRWV